MVGKRDARRCPNYYTHYFGSARELRSVVQKRSRSAQIGVLKYIGCLLQQNGYLLVSLMGGAVSIDA